MAAWTCAGCTTTYTVGAPACPHCGSTERNDRAGGAVLPSLTVECQTDGCMHVGKRRRVHLRTAAPGVLEMPSLRCAGCGLEMYQVAPWPPVTDTENTMPKITRHGGASNRHDPETAGAAESTPAEAAPAPDPDEEEVQPSPGTSSSPSSEKPPTTSEPSEPDAPKRARTTASRSRKSTASSSARSTDGEKTDESSDN